MTEKRPFADLPCTPATHFRLYFYAAVSQVLAAVAARAEASELVNDCVRALSGYADELRACGVPDLPAPEALVWWARAIAAWEATVAEFLPARALRSAIGAAHEDILLVFVAGLIEEDARFGSLFELMNAAHGQAGQPRATVALLADCRRESGLPDVRVPLRLLADCGIVRLLNAEAPRIQHGVEVPAGVWDALRGEWHARPLPWLRYQPPSVLPEWDDLILPAGLAERLTAVPRLVAAGDAQTIVLRGPLHNGRRTLLAAIARVLGRGILEITGADRGDRAAFDDDRWQQVALLATAMHAMPIVACEPGPGERVEIPRASWFDGPIGIALGRSGGVGGAAADRAITLTLDIPSLRERREHWRRTLGSRGDAGTDVETMADRYRLAAGQIRRTATLASAQAALSGRSRIDAQDVRQAMRLLNAQTFDALATCLSCGGDWTHLAAREDTIRELADLELRCRHRERVPPSLGHDAGGSAGCGVRALFRGPSGSGKSLAARLLASVLQKDLYRVDLSSIVNKYIGETEKNLDRVISRAEELDVVLLFDEGDALLTQRTGVSNANDRYANLETNFLLQRLEVFDGILVITTNAGERIDAAFERRMDVIVEFQPPQPAERWELWQLHLPRGHVVSPDFLDELATRCVLSGGQIRNAVQHASLQATALRRTVDGALLDAAVRREYRKAGAVCPLRSSGLAVAGV
jgi:hypothetical protein